MRLTLRYSDSLAGSYPSECERPTMGSRSSWGQRFTDHLALRDLTINSRLGKTPMILDCELSIRAAGTGTM
jgi:hypothetical protein